MSRVRRQEDGGVSRATHSPRGGHIQDVSHSPRGGGAAGGRRGLVDPRESGSDHPPMGCGAVSHPRSVLWGGWDPSPLPLPLSPPSLSRGRLRNGRSTRTVERISCAQRRRSREEEDSMRLLHPPLARDASRGVARRPRTADATPSPPHADRLLSSSLLLASLWHHRRPRSERSRSRNNGRGRHTHRLRERADARVEQVRDRRGRDRLERAREAVRSSRVLLVSSL